MGISHWLYVWLPEGVAQSFESTTYLPSDSWLLWRDLQPQPSKKNPQLFLFDSWGALSHPGWWHQQLGPGIPSPGARARAGLGSLFTPWEKVRRELRVAAALDGRWSMDFWVPPENQPLLGDVGGGRWSFSVLGWWTSRNGWISMGRVVIIHLVVPKEEQIWSSVAPVLSAKMCKVF